jgi:hypothetical protein
VLEWHYEFLGRATPSDYAIYDQPSSVVVGESGKFYVQVCVVNRQLFHYDLANEFFS